VAYWPQLTVHIHTYTSVKKNFPYHVSGYILIFWTMPSNIIKILSPSLLMSLGPLYFYVNFSLFMPRKHRKSGGSDVFILNLRTKCKPVVSFIHRSFYRKNRCFSVNKKLGGLQSRSEGYDLEYKYLLSLPGVETQLLTRPSLDLTNLRLLYRGSFTLLCVNNKRFHQDHFNYMHHHNVLWS
jgi:hypothetical protein